MSILLDLLTINNSQDSFPQQYHQHYTQKQTSLKKYFRVCNCCQKLVFVDPNSNDSEHDQHRSEQNDPDYEPQPTKSLTKIIQDALDDRYYELDNFIKKWQSLFFYNQRRYRSSLIVLMDKFAASYQIFQSDVHWAVNNKYLKYLVFTSQGSFQTVLIQKYKEYIDLKFKIIKDYLSNFKLSCLNQEEFNEIHQLRLNNGLVDSYMEEMLKNKINTKQQQVKVQVKKENTKQQEMKAQAKKENKTKKKKKCKCKANLNAEIPNKTDSQEEVKVSQTITMLKVLKISDQQRKCCNCSQKWLKSISLIQDE